MDMTRLGRVLFFGVAVALAAGGVGVAQEKAGDRKHWRAGGGAGDGESERRSGTLGAGGGVVVNGRAYLVDCGPGVVRRAAAAEKNGFAALKAKELKMVFITHLHSDHTLGYPDLIFSPWVLGRKEPLEAYGPRGLKRMTEHIEHAWAEDVRVRRQGLEEANASGYKVNVHEIGPGVVYRDENVTVTAFRVKHGTWKEAYGYKFETKDRRIVISGDTAPTDEVVKACDGCDVLLHEVYNPHGDELNDEHWKKYFADVSYLAGGTGGDRAAGATEAAGAVSPGAGKAAGGGPGGAGEAGVCGEFCFGEGSGGVLMAEVRLQK